MTLWWLHSDGLLGLIELWAVLMIGHALADFSLQTEFMARAKNRHVPHGYPDLPTRTLWVYCLTAHALVHAGAVWLITGNAAFGLAEFILHWLIDWMRIEGKRVNFHLDQALHIACKVIYVLIVAALNR